MDGKIPSQNLIRQVNTQAPSRQPGFYKPFVFDILTVFSALALGYVYGQYLAGKLDIAALVVAIGVYAVFGTLQVFFSKTVSHRFATLLLEIIALLGFFYSVDFKLLAISAAIILVFFLWGDLMGKKELDNGLEIRFFKTATPFLKKFTTAIVLVLVILYLPQLDQNHPLLSKTNFQVVFDWTAGLVTKFRPEIDLNSSFGKLAEAVARLQLQDNENFKSLSAAGQEELIRQTAGQLFQAIGKNLGTTISPDEPAGNVLYGFIIGQVGGLREQFGSLFLLIWALIVFLTVRGFGIFFYWFAGLLAFTVYQILLASGFIHVLGESRTHEVIVF